MDIAFAEGASDAHDEEAIALLIIFLLWRILRIINGVVVVVDLVGVVVFVVFVVVFDVVFDVGVADLAAINFYSGVYVVAFVSVSNRDGVECILFHGNL